MRTLVLGAFVLLAGCGCGDDDDDAVGDGGGDHDASADAGSDAGSHEDAGADSGTGLDAGVDAAVDECCPFGGTCCRAEDLGYPEDLCVGDGEVCPTPCALCAKGQWCRAATDEAPAECLDTCPEPQKGQAGICCPVGSKFVEGVGCPLPDLTIDEEYLATHIILANEDFEADSCEIVEGCIAEPGNRRLLRFGLRTPNIGEGDLHFGDPRASSLFQWSECHGHNHFNSYARYRLLDANGNEVAPGHKQAFCLLDYEPIDPLAPYTPEYRCDYQGIQAGWADIYTARLPCQWIDITDVPAGDYTIEASVNFEGVIVESDVTNNVARIPYHLDERDLNSCPNGCPDMNVGCCIPGDPCSFAQDGYCDCLGQQPWDAVDCGHCTTVDDPQCPPPQQ